MNPVSLDALARRRPLSLAQLQRLSSVLESRGDWDQLYRIFLEIRRDANNAGKLIGYIDYVLAGACFHRNDLLGAVECARLAIRVEPSFPYAYLLLGRCYARLGKLAPAVASLRHCCSLAPANGWAWCELGRVQIGLSHWHEARLSLTRAQACLGVDSSAADRLSHELIAVDQSSGSGSAMAASIAEAWQALEQAELLSIARGLWGDRLSNIADLRELTPLEESELRLQQLTSQLDAVEASLNR